MKSRKLLIIILIFMALGQIAARLRHVEKRDLTKYDNGGSFNFAWEVALDHEQMRSKLREFIWQHWVEKRLGYVVATFHSIEGDPTTDSFYVEPDSKGRWRVVSEYERMLLVLYKDKKKKKRKVERGVNIYDVVVRVANEKSSSSGSQEITESENRQPTTYRLRLGRGSRHGVSNDVLFLL